MTSLRELNALDRQEALDRGVFARMVALEAQRDPDRLALIFENDALPDERVTAADLALNGNRIAHALRRDGRQRGDHVAIMMRNHPEFVYGLVANSKLAHVTVPIDPRTRGAKLDYFLDFGDCAAVLTADYVVADADAAEPLRRRGVPVYVLSTPEGRAQGLDPGPEWRSLNEILEAPEAPDVGQHVDDVYGTWLLAFTSGTTGDPKGILFGYERLAVYSDMTTHWDYGRDDIPYSGLSLTHGNALVVTMLPAILGKVRHSVFSRWFTKSRLWDICRAYGCTTWCNLGGLASAIYGEPPSPKDRAHPVRLVLSAGMPRELWEPFEQRFGVRILEWYGTTEGIAFAANQVGVGPIASFGKPPEGVIEMDVVDEQGRSLPPGEIGELIARPAGGEAHLEYYKNPEASTAKIRNGWLYTGDMCRRDADGWYHYVHRKEQGVIRKLGEYVSEGFIQRVIAEHPDVVDVFVYGVPTVDGAPGESAIVAAVVPGDAGTFDPAGLLGLCRQRLERSHVPDFLQVLAELPKTSSGKIQARPLAAQLESSEACTVYRRAELLGETATP